MFNSFPIPKPDSGGSNIKSTQRGSTTFVSGSTLDIPITLVDMSKSIIILEFYYGTSAPYTGLFAPTFVDGSKIRLNKGGTFTSGSLIIYWQVIEFNNVKSKQTGTKVNSVNTEETVTVTEFNTSKYILISNLTSTVTSSTDPSFYVNACRVISSTSIGITSNVSPNVVNYYQLLEFN